ncbi:MAG: hypothetical protein JSR44_09880 [Spirochaetes bacterium]|nr:hypothetical protein [Spirochaetota bacterium]
MVDDNHPLAAKAPWQSCIAVCSKCAKKIGQLDGDKTRLRVALKALIAERGLKEKVRAVDSSCFDICPENRITVAHFTPQGIRMITVPSTITAAAILAEFGY